MKVGVPVSSRTASCDVRIAGLAWRLRVAAPPGVIWLHADGGTLVEVSPLCPQGIVRAGTQASRLSQRRSRM